MKLKNDKGMTILEVLIAVVIFAFGFSILLVSFASILKVAKQGADLSIATNLARNEMEKVKNIDFPPVYGDRTADFNKVRFVSPDKPKFKIEVITVGEVGYQDVYGNDIVNKVSISVYKGSEFIPIFVLGTYITRNG